MKENTVIYTRNVLIAQCTDDFGPFCGRVYRSMEEYVNDGTIKRCTVYFCGVIDEHFCEIDSKKVDKVYLVNGYVSGTCNYKGAELVERDELPQDIYGVGVWFPRLFQSKKNYFKAVESEHQFQSLTESNKPRRALRSGIYMTPVEKKDDGVYFNLLRCSSNFDGPTDNYRDTDYEIVDLIKERVRPCFQTDTLLNHTLAQIYHNSVNEVNGRSHKAKIKEHSDKTKDMPINGLIAFCTFYEQFDGDKGFTGINCSGDDYKYKDTSVLTRLRFRLKPEVQDDLDQYSKKFDILLLPNSVFVIPLSTNRLYTHEIVPAGLESTMLPTRMGYVIRCSNTPAVHRNGQTFIIQEDKEVPLVSPTNQGIDELRKLYYKENLTTELVTYDQIYFSMNGGDYKEPIV